MNILKASYGSNAFWGFWISLLLSLFCKLDSVLHSPGHYRTKSLCYLEVSMTSWVKKTVKSIMKSVLGQKAGHLVCTGGRAV